MFVFLHELHISDIWILTLETLLSIIQSAVYITLWRFLEAALVIQNTDVNVGIKSAKFIFVLLLYSSDMIE